MEAKLASVYGESVKLRAKLIDLENRNRRNNIRIVGLPENIEGDQRTVFFFLVEVFGEQTLDSARSWNELITR